MSFQSKYFGTVMAEILRSKYDPKDIKDFFLTLEEIDTVAIKVKNINNPEIDHDSKLEVQSKDGVSKTISAQLFLALMPGAIRADVERYISHYSRITTIFKKIGKETRPVFLYEKKKKSESSQQKQIIKEEDPFIGDNLSFLQKNPGYEQFVSDFFDDLRNDPSVIFTKEKDKNGKETYFIKLERYPKKRISLQTFIRAGGERFDHGDDGKNFATFERLCKKYKIKNRLDI